MSGVTLLFAITAYLALLFWLARMGDQRRFKTNSWVRHPLVYTLALGVYCTSWTFYGLVGTAASRGWYYLPILLGPILLFTLGYPLLQRIASVSRQENIHSIADFITSRYGKRQSVAVIVTLIMLATTVPYIALQLKAVTDTLLFSVDYLAFASEDMTMLVAVAMILFTLIFGANRLDVSSYHSGIMVAIAFESLVKLIALVAIALFAITISTDFDVGALNHTANRVFQESTLTPSFWILTLVSAATIFCLPRMFQITFVECLSEKHLKFARGGFSLYLIAIAGAVIIISWVGNQTLAATNVASDMYVLALPLGMGNKILGLLAFIGGFSAATAMIIVASLTLSQMLSNDVILPLLIRKQKSRSSIPDYSGALILTRRLTVAAIIFMAWLYQHSLAENVALTEIGLIAFALAVQLAPVILFGLYWHRGNAMGVFAGIGCGVLIWFFTLMLPLLVNAGFFKHSLLEHGLLGIALLKPENLLGFSFSDSYTRGVVLSLSANIIAYYFVSRLDKTRLSDRIQALAFVNRRRTPQLPAVTEIKINKLDLSTLLTQFLGSSATDRLMLEQPSTELTYISHDLLVAAEQALSGVVGVASARALLTSLSKGESLGVEDVVNIFEETTRTLQFNQDMLFASFESISSAISVVNAELKIVAWNKRYEQMFNYPEGMLRIGRPAEELIRFNASRGMLGAGIVEAQVNTRLGHLTAGKPYRVIRNHNQGVIEIKGRPLPHGGYITTYDDISEFINTQNELEKVNLSLERRVHERTEEIEKINLSLREEIEKRRITEIELLKAKSIAEKSNASKTQFLAIASHDILQPLNAANLYASALLERPDCDEPKLNTSLQHLHGAIGSAELIISNLLEISRLDTGSLKAKFSQFALADILEPLVNDFCVQTNAEVILRYHPSSLWTESDPKYLRRILQNFLSNAVKYTRKGKILIGCLREAGNIKVCIYDTGSGISEVHQQRIFEDFYRISSHVDGAGLGLGIALRFSHLLGHKIHVESTEGKGSLFSILLPRRLKQARTAADANIVSCMTSGLEQMKIFYVDDEQNNIHALGTLIGSWGCSIDSANDAQSALAYVQKNSPPDVLLMDYQLGDEIDGLQLAQSLREIWTDVPVCIVSAAAQEDLAKRASHQGFDFLRKPVKPGKLRALLERYLQL